MIRKFIKTGISLALAFSLAMLPISNVFSKTIADLPQSQIASASTLDSLAIDATNYDEVKKLAEIKASILTSIYGVTSIQYALIDNGEIVLSGQAGVYSKGETTALTDNSMYGIGSISKMYTTVAVMQLVEQGKVKLDTPVIKYLPEFKMADARYKDITVRMLLNHSSGLMGSTFSNSMLFDDNDSTNYKNSLLNELKTSRLKADPGEFSVYCNDGFTLAELLVEKVTGISFTEYISKNISDPLGMVNTKTPKDDFQRSLLAKTYLPIVKTALPTECLGVIGAGGIYSSATDLCQFAEIFMNNSTSKVLSASSTKAMGNAEYLTGLWPQEADSIISYGLGWDSVNTYPFTEYGIKALVKGGDTTLYHGSLVVLPGENMAMAVLSSGGASTYGQIMAQEVLLSALKATGSIDEILANKTFVKPVKASMPSNQKKYEGIYAYAGGGINIAISDDGNLTLTNIMTPSSGTQKFIYTGDGKFYYSDGSVYLSFVEESNGTTYLYVASYSLLPNIGQLANAEYQAQKITDNPISQKIKTVWEKRANKNYFVINEKYTSQAYALGSLSTKIIIPKELEGYCNNAAIIDKNTARTLIQIPGLYGRDLSDYTFYNIGETEYLKISGSIAISEDAIKSLSTKSAFTCKISADGYAHWYKISKKSENKKVKIVPPKNSSFSVYDANGTCVNYSFLSKQDTVTLPAKGFIVFVGNANASFAVRYVK